MRYDCYIGQVVPFSDTFEWQLIVSYWQSHDKNCRVCDGCNKKRSYLHKRTIKNVLRKNFLLYNSPMFT